MENKKMTNEELQTYAIEIEKENVEFKKFVLKLYQLQQELINEQDPTKLNNRINAVTNLIIDTDCVQDAIQDHVEN